MVRTSGTQHLEVHNFAQIKHARVPLADLVVLVGPQATGKTLLLQLMKLLQDRNAVAGELHANGMKWVNDAQFATLYFGEGMDEAWTEGSVVQLDGKTVSLEHVRTSRRLRQTDSVFYIPAHRTHTIAEGWPRSFLQHQSDAPYVARVFGERLRAVMTKDLASKADIWPPGKRLVGPLKELLDEAVFHGGKLILDQEGTRKQFKLQYGTAKVPFMGWSAGQREFIPLLLGLYYLLPPSKVSMTKGVEWVVIEEPEMGLHPKAVVAVMAQVLALLGRGYKVALSTHSPTVLNLAWTLGQLKDHPTGATLLQKALSLKGAPGVAKVMKSALQKSISVTYLRHVDGNRVEGVDISPLKTDTEAPKEERTWGGLTEFDDAALTAVLEAKRAGGAMGRLV